MAGRSLLVSALPALPFLISYDWLIRAALIAVAGSLPGASYPA